MGQTDFDFGYNVKADYGTPDPPTYQQACMGMMVCPHCGKSVMCGDVASSIQQGEQTNMDMGQYKGSGGSSRLPWLDAENINDKDKLKIDATREPRKKGKVVIYLDVTVTSTKKKHTWSIRKGFTLDALIELLGAESDNWKGKIVPVVRGGDEGQYVNVSN